MPQSRPLVHSAGKEPFVPRPTIMRASASDIDLLGVVVAVIEDQPMVRIVTHDDAERLPTARFRFDASETLEDCLRRDVATATGLDFGFVEQLATTALPAEAGRGRLAIGYLTLAHGAEADPASWVSWYAYFPWEDWRHGRPQILRDAIEPKLRAFAARDDGPDAAGLTRLERVRMAFGLDGMGWDEERVVERYSLLQESGLGDVGSGRRLPDEHQRTLALAIARLRSRIKSRPVVFELMPERFTLFELQRTVEAILGPHLHKQNFRRLVEHMGLVEPTEEIKSHTGGRPAKLFRFRQSVLLERMQPGVRVRTARA